MGSTIQINQVLNQRYRIDQLLGIGGYGSVYKAWDLNLLRFCAIKHSADISPKIQEQFKREATILAGLNHPNLPHVSDFFVIPDQGQYLVMDYVEGIDLEALLAKRKAPLREDQVMPWMMQICDALSYLHAQTPPVIHRDIKPANIRITPERKAMLVDFGIAKTYSAQVNTLEGARGVTAGFSPPEQYGSGGTNEQSDLYSLAATLYCLLTNTTPTESIHRAAGIGKGTEPGFPKDVSAQVRQAIERAMSLEQEKRFATVAQFKEALQPRGKKILPSLQKYLTLNGTGIGAILLMVLVVGCMIMASMVLPRYLNPGTPLVQTEVPLAAATDEPSPTLTLPAPTPSRSISASPQASSTLTPTMATASATSTFTPGPTQGKNLLSDTPTPTELLLDLTCDFRIEQNIVARLGPGANFTIVGYLSPGTIVKAEGRNEDSSWILVLLPSGRKGWITTVYVVILDPNCRLPFVINTLTPAPTNTPKSGDGSIFDYP